jgi:hypothetical protein
MKGIQEITITISEWHILHHKRGKRKDLDTSSDQQISARSEVIGHFDGDAAVS